MEEDNIQSEESSNNVQFPSLVGHNSDQRSSNANSTDQLENNPETRSSHVQNPFSQDLNPVVLLNLRNIEDLDDGDEASVVSSDFDLDFDISTEENNEIHHPISLRVLPRRNTENSNQSHERSSNSSSSEEEDNGAQQHPFDIQLPYQHSYLGKNLESIPGRNYLDENSIHTLPLLLTNVIPGLSVLIPGQTIPLNFVNPVTKKYMEESLSRGQKIFGFVNHALLHQILAHDSVTKDIVGVTLEIFEHTREEEEYRCKARVTQRFKVLSPPVHDRTNCPWMCVRVLILSEVLLDKPLKEVRHQSLNRLRRNHPKYCNMRESLLTHWPSFVYETFDCAELVKHLHKNIRQLIPLNDPMLPVGGSKVCIPDDPIELSYWVLTNFPMNDTRRHEVLQLDNVFQRLRILLEHFESFLQSLLCTSCFEEVAMMKDLFVMSASGPQGAYVNPNGYIHETMTVYKALNLNVDSVFSTEFSWFPGYAWSIASCKQCMSHIGWKFKAVERGLMPKSFFGISKKCVVLYPRHRQADLMTPD